VKDDKTVEYYQKRAGEYDKIYYRDDPVRQSELHTLYAMSQEVLRDRTVLDLACGTGFWTKIVSEAARSITGIDINAGTIEEAEKKTYGCPVEFILSDVFAPPDPLATFNGFLATFLISHIRRQDLDRLVDIWKPFFEPGARAFISDNNLICELRPELVWDDEKVNTYKKRTLENGEQYLILKNYFEKDELESIFSRWGKIENLWFDKYYWAVTVTLP